MALKEEFESQGNWLFRYRGVLPLIILVAGLVFFGFNVYFDGYYYSKVASSWPWYVLLSLAVCIFGQVIRILTVGFTPAGTSGRNIHGQLAEELNSTGIYSTVRHPLYVGNFFMWLGVAMLTCSIGFILIFCLAYWIYYERIMYAEEQFLTRKFGDKYTQWASRTPAFIVSFKNYVRPALPFSWKKILSKEKNGLLYMFLTFMVFDLCKVFVESHFKVGMMQTFDYVMVGLGVFSVVVYFILRALRDHTSLLNEEGR